MSAPSWRRARGGSQLLDVTTRIRLRRFDREPGREVVVHVEVGAGNDVRLALTRADARKLGRLLAEAV